MYRKIVSALLGSMALMGAALAQDRAAKSSGQDPAAQTPPPTTAAPDTEIPTQPSDAERITRLQRTIEEDGNRLNELNDKLNDPAGEYPKAEAEFKSLDQELEAKRKELQKLDEEDKSDQAAKLRAELGDLEKRWKLAKDRFDLAIQERKTLQEQRSTLEQKITQDKEALDKLLAPPATQPAVASGPAPTTVPTQPTGAVAGEPAAGQAAGQQQSATPAAAPDVPAAPSAEKGPAPQAAPAGPTMPPSKELRDAEKVAEAKEAEALTAEEAVRSIEARIEKARADLELARKQLQTARAQVENADETRRILSEQIQKRSTEGAPQAELQERWTKLAEARQRYRDAKAEVTRLAEQVDKSQEALNAVQTEHIQTLQEAEAARQAAEEARKKVESIKNPFAPQNLLKWAVEHGPKIVGIVLAMFVLLWLARVLEHRFVRLVAGRGGPGTAEDREDRAKTLVSVFHNAASLVIIVGGILMIITEFGIAVAPLLGGAAVIGLAVAFGAQNLVRDYFSGFMILLENQYAINDVIKVGDIAGLVERITLRVTVLRGLDGTVHFVPNGQIDKVSNMTHGWSRALFEIGVAYKEDVDQVMDLLVSLGKEMRRDPQYRHLILDDPEMLGVDSFGDSAVVIKFFIKTRPLQQWAVKRALLRRIKKKFDEVGIEIPFPHRTVFHRHEGEVPPPVHAESSGHSV